MGAKVFVSLYNELFEVEEIYEERVGADGKLWLHVSWEGFEEEFTWIRAEEVSKELLEEFWQG